MQPVRDIVKKLGGWPVLDGEAWQDGDFEWKQSVKKFRKQGFSVDYFFDFSINIDFKNSTKRVLEVCKRIFLPSVAYFLCCIFKILFSD